uniref:Uncharacterized protein n=1 Tax=Kalanchoe fedtschenkoi TaxID=63787 RepID=A0A7N0UC85_KALFE
MAAGWVKSLQCKTRAFDDVRRPNPNPSPKTLISSSSCRKSVQSIKDVIDTASKPSAETRKRRPTTKPKSCQEKPRSSSGSLASVSDLGDTTRILRVIPSDSIILPTLTELGEGHPSRKVVEIIFQTSWSPGKAPFSGKVEMVFKVQNPARTVTRFEEFREVIKTRAVSGSDDHGRCLADGNEMLRFHCLGPTAAGAGGLAFPGGKGKAVCTFSCSGRAHESGGGGSGRKGMMVCRVIAGRVEKRVEEGINDSGPGGSGFGSDSVSGSGGELVVLDPRAVLPCFLIIYKV